MVRLSTTLFVIVGGFLLAEFAAFIWISDLLGLGTALMLGIATSLLGIAVISRQGRTQLLALRHTFLAGGSVAFELTNGALVLFAGLLLFIPGFITDVLGLLLLLPPVRAAIWNWWHRRRTDRIEIL